MTPGVEDVLVTRGVEDDVVTLHASKEPYWSTGLTAVVSVPGRKEFVL